MSLVYKHPGFIHLNGNLLCSLTINVSGNDPIKHDLIELAVLPLNHLAEPNRTIVPFHMCMKKRKDEVDFKTMSVKKEKLYDILINGVDGLMAGDLFIRWFELLELPPNKRIVPLTYNWPVIRPFLVDWLGPLNFNHIFDYRYRDLMQFALFENDIDCFRNEPYRFPKHIFQYLCSCLKVEREAEKDALIDCVHLSECFVRLLVSHIH